MKVSKTFRLSEEATAVLDKQTNATEFLEALILGNYQRPLEVVSAQTLQALLEAEFEKLGKLPQMAPPVTQTGLGSSEVFVPRPPDPATGYPCCEKATPCKHWAFDGIGGVWRNSLTGATKES